MFARCDHADLIASSGAFGYLFSQVHVRGFDLLAGERFRDRTIQFCHMLTAEFIILERETDDRAARLTALADSEGGNAPCLDVLLTRIPRVKPAWLTPQLSKN